MEIKYLLITEGKNSHWELNEKSINNQIQRQFKYQYPCDIAGGDGSLL